MDFHKPCHSSNNCCFARNHSFWLISPDVVFIDGHSSNLEFFCNFFKIIGTVTRHPFFINQCAFKISPDILHLVNFDTIDKIYNLFNLSKNRIPLKFRKFLRQAFKNTSSHQDKDESISKAFQISFGRHYNEKVCSVPLAVAVHEKLEFYQSKYEYRLCNPLVKIGGVIGLVEIIYLRYITREEYNASATKIQSKWGWLQSKDKARSLCHQKHVATITIPLPWILFQENVCTKIQSIWRSFLS